MPSIHIAWRAGWRAGTEEYVTERQALALLQGADEFEPEAALKTVGQGKRYTGRMAVLELATREAISDEQKALLVEQRLLGIRIRSYVTGRADPDNASNGNLQLLLQHAQDGAEKRWAEISQQLKPESEDERGRKASQGSLFGAGYCGDG